ncbi:hypothetical protein EOU05_23705 [Salmonella enterica]|nr:hypothetical protein [Salmonella enterica]OCI36558.1 hypothetical protein BBD25_14165 [Salmonella enterica]OIX00251.1 hypothetical protein APP91_13500 [Salmonella enterica subsp. enterica serovar Oranienburg]OSJ49226.1 hypothetical protein K793_08481 [Salmonella enterica subsp. enterica serovar Newport str. SHSN003]
MADPFPEPEHRISVYADIKLLFFILLYFSCFTNLHKITHLKLNYPFNIIVLRIQATNATDSKTEKS